MKRSTLQLALVNSFLLRYPREAAKILNDSTPAEVVDYFASQSPEIAAEILSSMTPGVVPEVLELMDNDLFVSVFDQLDDFKATQLLSRIDKKDQQEKLGLLSEKRVRQIKELLNYPPDSAGFLMDTRIHTFKPGQTAGDVLDKLRVVKDRRILNIYVTNDHNQLLGRIPLQTIAISNPKALLDDLMEPSISVEPMAPEEEIVNLFQEGKIFGLPVVDHNNEVLGIIRNDALIAAAQKDATEDVLAIFGAGREERALSKVSFAIKKRLPWLEINLATAFLAASIVGIFEDTIARITVLAVFLPVVAGQSGNTGSQALAVTIRGLALREINTTHWWQVARKEVAVGFFNGIAVALTTSAIVFVWASSFGLAIVIGTSMILSMVIAGFSGAVIPIMLKSFGQDPAQSSSIVLTTVTDIVGFLSFLGLATVLGTALGIV
ncbi:MAG: magnesium transporter [Cyclobacteriaceae bacterium]